MHLSQAFSLTTQTGPSVQAGRFTVTPVARALVVRWGRGAVVWNRPSHVMVSEGGTVRRIAVPDLTLWLAVAALLVAPVVLAVLVSMNRLPWRAAGRKEDHP